jgi:16S rRNA (adenine1518-N6/adenine1519-N6)-dimethyltransferase
VPRQRLGQHFLVQLSILDRIAAAACPLGTPLVVEIGPGKGALTERLLARADRVVAIELDERLAELLREKFPDGRLEVVSADVLDVDLNQWGPAVVAGNLPYYISTAILTQALAPGSLLERGVFLVQKEVAARITASPGSRAYGYLSVEMQFYADVKLLFEVRPGAFHPPPKVDSALIGFTLRSRAQELGIDSPEEFLKFVRLCFHQKRKTIRNNLVAAYGNGQITGWPEAPRRAEQLTLEQIAAMYLRLVG